MPFLISVDMDVLSRGVHIVVGTPGRILDLLQRRAFDTTKIKLLVCELLLFGLLIF